MNVVAHYSSVANTADRSTHSGSKKTKLGFQNGDSGTYSPGRTRAVSGKPKGASRFPSAPQGQEKLMRGLVTSHKYCPLLSVSAANGKQNPASGRKREGRSPRVRTETYRNGQTVSSHLRGGSNGSSHVCSNWIYRRTMAFKVRRSSFGRAVGEQINQSQAGHAHPEGNRTQNQKL